MSLSSFLSAIQTVEKRGNIPRPVSLLQWYPLRIGRKELNVKTRTRIMDMLRPTATVILIFYQNYVAYLSPLEHQELVLTLDEHARKKILAKTRRLRRSLANQIKNPRPP